MNVEQSENINELIGALAKAQGEMNGALKDANNPHYNSKYADLGSIWNACRTPLSKNELAVIQTTSMYDGQLMLVTTLGHSSGQWMRGVLPIKYNESATEINKYGKEIKVNALQKLGSCLTYLKRYALGAIIGVAPEEDDDGNEGGKVFNNAPEPKRAEVISKDQVETLANILADCDPKYQASVFDSLRKPPINVESLERLPVVLFDRIKNAALKNRDSYQSTILPFDEREEEAINE